LAYPEVESVTLVDLDPAITSLAVKYPELHELNHGSLDDRRLTVLNDDALRFLADGRDGRTWDVAIVDFPDPNNFSLGKLYTTRFYALLKAALSDGGVAVVQSTSPLFARQSFWCVAQTLKAAGFDTRPYHAWVPS